MKKRIILVLTAALTVLALAGCAGGSTSGSTTSGGSASGGSTPAASAPATYGVGTTQVSGDLTITLLGYRESTGTSEWSKPDEGNVFVICEFEVENSSSKEQTVSSILCFEAFGDGYKIDQDYFADTTGSLDGTLPAGRKLKGEIAFQMSTDWKTLEVIFNDNFLLDSHAVTFTITK